MTGYNNIYITFSQKQNIFLYLIQVESISCVTGTNENVASNETLWICNIEILMLIFFFSKFEFIIAQSRENL